MKNILEIGLQILDKVIPDKAAREAAQLELLKMDRSHELEMLKASLGAIVSDSQSADPWTSRARPAFLYVVYFQIMMAPIVGVMTIFNPEAAAHFSSGYSAWLAAIPEPILTLFGVVMTGYVAGRSWEKVRGAAK